MVKKLLRALVLQQKYPIKERARVVFMLEDRGALHTRVSVGVEYQANMGVEQMWVPGLLLRGAPGGPCPAAPTSPSGIRKMPLKYFVTTQMHVLHCPLL